MDLEKAYNRVNREVLWQVYNVGGKLWNRIRSMYVKSSLCKGKRVSVSGLIVV